MDNITEIKRIEDAIRKQRRKYAEDLYSIGEAYEKALEHEQSAVADTTRIFCAGMIEAYKNALIILSGYK